jgi:hypothetical protein
MDYSPARLAVAAGVDPWALAEQVGSGVPDEIRELGRQFRAAAGLAAETARSADDADEALAAAFLNDQQPVHDKEASRAATRTLLAENGELMEETARIMLTVGDGLAATVERVRATVAALELGVAGTIERRNGFLAANAATLPAADAKTAEARFLREAVALVRDHGRIVQREIDGYEALLINHVGRLRDVGYPAVGRPTRPPLETIEAEYQVTVDPGGLRQYPFDRELTAGEEQLLLELAISRGVTADPVHRVPAVLSVIGEFEGIETAAHEQAERVFAGPDQSDNHGDAFRHAYWNALLTREYGEQFAAAFTVAHERKPHDNALREAMDLYNNEIGRRIAVQHPDADRTELARLVADAVRDGQTVVIGADGRLAFSDSVPIGLAGDPADVPVPAGADPSSFAPPADPDPPVKITTP